MPLSAVLEAPRQLSWCAGRREEDPLEFELNKGQRRAKFPQKLEAPAFLAGRSSRRWAGSECHIIYIYIHIYIYVDRQIDNDR